MQRVPVELVPVPKLWPPNTAARVSGHRIYITPPHWPPTRTLLAHELRHVIDRHRLGWRFLPAYLWAWAVGGFTHHCNRFEMLARVAETDPFYLNWASELLAELQEWEAA